MSLGPLLLPLGHSAHGDIPGDLNWSQGFTLQLWSQACHGRGKNKREYQIQPSDFFLFGPPSVLKDNIPEQGCRLVTIQYKKLNLYLHPCTHQSFWQMGKPGLKGQWFIQGYAASYWQTRYGTRESRLPVQCVTLEKPWLSRSLDP